MERDIFISYSRKDYDAVMNIKRKIDAATGTECWIDLKGIESGNSLFTDEIIDGINNCKIFLFMLTEQSQSSHWALRELAFAEKKNKRVILVNVDGCEMNDRFSFTYSLTDIIVWNIKNQQEKLINDLCRWIGSTPNHGVTLELTSTQESKLTPVSTSTTFHSLKELEEFLAKLDREVGNLNLYKDSRGKFCYVNKTGKIVIPGRWDDAKDFSEGLAAVKDSNGKWGFIEKTGKLIIPYSWYGAERFKEDLGGVKDSNDKWGFINKKDEIVIPCRWENVDFYSEGLAAVMDSNKKWGFINKTGKLVVPCKWDYASPYNEDGWTVVEDSFGNFLRIDRKGKVLEF